MGGTIQSEVSQNVCVSFNVEFYISQIGGIKYVEYVCKGHYQITVELVGESGNQRYDKIRNLQDARYLSTPEALCQISRFGIVDRSPPVVWLDVDFETLHTLYFGEGQERQA